MPVISDRLKYVILRELDLEEFEIVESTTASMVPGWDSLSHIRIITAVEAEFGVRFKTLEVLRLTNVGDLQTLLDTKIGH
jgi:acyl carrier protein